MTRVKSNPDLWLAISFIVGFFAVGIPFWQIPYSQVTLPDTLYDIGLLFIVIGAALSKAFAGAGTKRSMVVIGSAVPAAVLARICVEVSIDPTTHNLLPFELMFASFVGFSGSLFGTVIGSAVLFIRKKISN